MASLLLFDDSCRHMVHQSLYFMLMSLIRVCLVFYFALIVSVTSLSFFADDHGHHTPQMLENYGGIK